jgi:hypothetical protein
MDSDDSLKAILPDLVNDDDTVNLDLEGIAVASQGGFWLVSEGDGDKVLNILLHAHDDGVITDVITLPEEINAKQTSNGFEGVAEGTGKYEGYVAVAFQRAWMGEDEPRIGWYHSETHKWTFFFYPLDEVQSPNGGWVGLSDIAPLGGAEFLVVERDNQGGPDGVIKTLQN